MNWRLWLFWIKDFFQGGKVLEAYKDLKNNYNNSKEHQIEKLKNILKIAKSNSKFYDKYNELDINSFPVINKQIIKDNFDVIFSNLYNKEKLHKMSTSGSTGIPFTIYQNKEKRIRVIAEVLFFGKIANFTFGQKEMFARIWVRQVKKSKFKSFLQNLNAFDISKLDDNNINKMLEVCKKEKTTFLLAYASTLFQLNRYISKTNYDLKKMNIKSIVSGSELLNEDTRKGLSSKFNCKVFSRYSNEENGILGQDTGVDKTFILNEVDYYFEFLKLDSDEWAKPGELSRIVITDLYNYSMPMIRYDTGDLCVYELINDKLYIKEIQGRKVDLIYDSNGKELSPHVITNNMWDVEKIYQWKFIQIGQKNYKLELNVEEGFSGEKELLEKLKVLLGKDANVVFEYKNEIPVLSSGKRKYIENLYR